MATVSELQTVLTADDSQLQSGLNRGDNRIQDFARNTNRRLGTMARNFASFGIGAGVAIGTAAITASVQWESSFADVRKTVGDLNEEELAELEVTLREMATTGVTGSLANAHEELAGIAALGGQLGVAGDDLDEFTETVAAFGVATDSLSTEEAALFFAQFANLTGLDIGEDVDNISDAVIHLGNNLSTTEDKIANYGLRLGNLANVGFEPDEILGWGAAMASLGISAERGSTNFTLSISDMQRAAREGGDELETFADTAGMASDEFAELANSDPSGAFDAFIAGLADLEASDAQQVLDDLNITGTEQRSVIMSLAGGYDTLTTSLDLAAEGFEGNEAAMTEAEAKADTTAGKLNLLTNKAKDLAIALGDELSPGFNQVLDGLIGFTEGDAGGGLSDVALGFTDMAESVAELFGAGGEEGLRWTEDLQTGIEVVGLLQDAIYGVGPAALALQIMWNNTMRNIEMAVLRVWIQLTGLTSQLRQTVLDVTGGQVDIAPSLALDRQAMMDQLEGMEIANLLTDFLRADLSDGFAGLDEDFWAVEVDGTTFLNNTSIAFEDIDAEGFGVEGRATIEAALLEAFRTGDEDAEELLLPLAAELELPIDEIRDQAHADITGTIEGETYEAVASVSVTLQPDIINTAGFGVSVSAAAAGAASGAATTINYNVTGYGQSPYDLQEVIEETEWASGSTIP